MTFNACASKNFKEFFSREKNLFNTFGVNGVKNIMKKKINCDIIAKISVI